MSTASANRSRGRCSGKASQTDHTAKLSEPGEAARNYKSLLFRREWPYFYAFDLLAVDREDLREWPLVERKRRSRRRIRSVPTRLLYVDHIQTCGKDFFEAACAHDLEGIVGKLARGRYHADGTSTNWLKINNPAYTQMTARHELFERPSGSRKRRPMRRVP